MTEKTESAETKIIRCHRGTKIIHLDQIGGAAIYGSVAEMKKAMKDGTYDIKKTQYVAKDGRVYFLCAL